MKQVKSDRVYVGRCCPIHETIITSLNTTIGALNDVVAKQKQLLANLRSAGILANG